MESLNTWTTNSSVLSHLPLSSLMPACCYVGFTNTVFFGVGGSHTTGTERKLRLEASCWPHYWLVLQEQTKGNGSGGYRNQTYSNIQQPSEVSWPSKQHQWLWSANSYGKESPLDCADWGFSPPRIWGFYLLNTREHMIFCKVIVQIFICEFHLRVRIIKPVLRENAHWNW